MVAVSLTTFAIRESLRCGDPVEIDADAFIAAALSADNEHTDTAAPTETLQFATPEITSR
jgi:hypothetical protein